MEDDTGFLMVDTIQPSAPHLPNEVELRLEEEKPSPGLTGLRSPCGRSLVQEVLDPVALVQRPPAKPAHTIVPGSARAS